MKRIAPALLLTLLFWTPSLAQRSSLRYHDIRDLRASAQSTPNMTVAVASGRVYVVGAQVTYAGGNSGSFTAPGANNRIDLLTINASGTLAITTGTAAATPTAPTAPAGTMPICLVYLKAASTSIQAYNTGGATHGYILADVRPFVTSDWLTPLGTMDMTPTISASDAIIYIQNTGALGANDYLKHIEINGDNLDPSGVETEIDGVDVDFSGIATTYNPLLIAFEAKMPRWGDHALYISQGHIQHYFEPSTLALAHHDAYNLVIDADAQDSTSHTHAMDVALADGLVGKVAAVATHVGIDPIHQHIGTMTAFGATYAGRLTSGPTYTDNIDDQDIWVADDDAILVGHSAVFDEIELIFTQAATKDVFLTFWYYKTTDGWTRFYPGDDTNGGRQDGKIRFNGADFTGWQSNYDPGTGADAGYWLKIQRTRVAAPGTVTLSTAKYLVATTYEWDKSGNITANDILAKGTLKSGVADVTRGAITAYGAATGVSGGGELDLHTSADYDTGFAYWQILAYQDDLHFKRSVTDSPGSALLIINGATQLVTVASSLTADSLLATGASGITLGADASPNIPGYIKMFSSGDDAFYSTFTSGDNTANAAYTLPVALPASNMVLQSTSAGVLSWISALGDVVGPGSATDHAIARWDLTTGKLLQDTANATLLDVGHLQLGGAVLDYATAYKGVYSESSSYVWTVMVGAYPILDMLRINGTPASPTAVASADILGNIRFGGQDDSALVTAEFQIRCTATENWLTTARGTKLDFRGTKTGGVSTTIWATLEDANLTLAGDLDVDGGNIDITKQATLAQLQMTTAATVVGPKIIGRESLGTLAVPTAIAANYPLLRIAGQGYGATGWSGDKALIDLASAQIFTDAAHGTKIIFYTTPLNSTTAAVAMTIGADKTLTLAGDLLVNGLNIGIDAETTLITLGAAEVDITANVDVTGVYKVDGLQVVSTRDDAVVKLSAVGSDQDGTARGKINEIIDTLRHHGLIPTP